MNDTDRILQWWTALSRLSGIYMNEYWSNLIENRLNLTSVLAQLQLMAVQRKRFMSNMMRNKTPKTIVSHNSQCGRIPALLSQIGETIGTSAGSSTKTVVAARRVPSSVASIERPDLICGSPHRSFSTHLSLHWMTSHWIRNSAPSGNLNIALIMLCAMWPSAVEMKRDMILSLTAHPRSSISGRVWFFLLKAKQFLTLIPCVPFGWLTSAFSV